jgi:tryptophan synthase alpha chain
VNGLLEHLTSARSDHKLLVPYLMAGIPDRPGYPDALRAIAIHADAVEVGVPFSDPLMDGPVIAAADERAIRSGVGPLEALDLSAEVATEIPRLAMTYYNPIHAVGEEEFCARVAKSGFAGLIVPDLPLEESASLRSAAADADLAWVPLVAPTTPAPRIEKIVATATGFVYAVSTLGVTGVRESLSERAGPLVDRCRRVTDLPVLIGIGVSTPQQAIEAAGVADGVVIGSAVVSRVLEQGPQAAADFLAEVRAALDTL